MRLVLRRALATKGLLTAAAVATLLVAVLLTALAEYGRQISDAGTRSAVRAATAEERSLLVRGSAGGSAVSLAERDSALRAAFADGLAGLPARVVAAGYATGRQLTGDTGSAVPDSDGRVFGSVVFLDGIADHAELTAGTWPQPGGVSTQATLAEPAATTLGVTVGDRIPITDRITGRAATVTVVGVWRPRDPGESYWRLVPGVAEGAIPQSATYGPIVVHRDDFTAHFTANASVAWLVEPELTAATHTQLARVAQAATALADTLPGTVGLDSSGLVATRLDELAARLARADLVGRSALVTPLLLLLVLGGYALLLVATLLTEQRRGEAALLRARGAARRQIAALVAREAVLVVLPALLLAPLLATELLRYAQRTPALADAALRFTARIGPVTWLVAGLAAAGCAAMMLAPALRRGGTYVDELAARSRPSRRSVAQRAGVDLALVLLAVLGWLQLRQYSSPLAGADATGALRIDPLLAAAPTVAVLAGAVLALRGLPPLASGVQRLVDRRFWTATVVGMWQAGRRRHAGPVLLLALAVAVSTLAWCLAATAQRSRTDQANHQVGADLRLVEASRDTPPVRDNQPDRDTAAQRTGPDRGAQLADLPGTTRVLPVLRDELRLGPEGQPAALVALDADGADQVVRYRADLAHGDPARLFADLAASRVSAPTVELAAGGDRLTGQVVTATAGGADPLVRTVAVLAEPNGTYRRVVLGASRNAVPLRFRVELPAYPGAPRLAGFLVETIGPPNLTVDWRLAGLRAGDGAGTPVPLTAAGAWRVVDRSAAGQPATSDAAGLTVRYQAPDRRGPGSAASAPLSFGVAPTATAGPVPVVATGDALAALGMSTGDETNLVLAGGTLGIRIVGSTTAVPGAPESAALLVDLPSLSAALFTGHARLTSVQEWWAATRADEPGVAARAAGQLGGLRVIERVSVAEQSSGDPYGVGARVALFAAALGAILLATVGVAVDVRATARRRTTELAVLHALGATPRLLVRSFLVEQGFLAGVGVLVGLTVGIGVAATMAPLVVLTPAAQRPVPPPILEIAWVPTGATALALLLLALALSALTAATMRGRLTAARLRIGEDQ